MMKVKKFVHGICPMHYNSRFASEQKEKGDTPLPVLPDAIDESSAKVTKSGTYLVEVLYLDTITDKKWILDEETQ